MKGCIRHIIWHDDKESSLPKTKLSGLNICPKGPALTESMVPGSRSISILRGTYLPITRSASIVHQENAPSFAG